MRRPWTAAEVEEVRRLYADTPTKEIARLLNRSVLSIYQAADKIGVRKTTEFKRQHCGLQPGSQVGAAYRFKPGAEPANKGLRRPGYAPGRMKETQFKPGHRSGKAEKNWRPIGTVLADHEGYLRIKVREAVYGKEPTGFGSMRVWPLLARHTWEQHHGPIPPGHVIRAKDGNRQNCAIENLEMLTQKENMRLNSIWVRMPRELAEVMQLSGALKRKLRKHAKE